MWSKGIVRAVVLTIALIVSTYEVLYGPGRELNIAAALVLAVTLFSIRKHHRVSYGMIVLIRLLRALVRMAPG